MKTIKIVTAALLVLCAAFYCAAEADYISGSYANIHRAFYNESDDQLQDPPHHMTEGVLFDQSKISAGSFGLSLQSGAVNYYTNFDYIPVPSKLLDATTGNPIDYNYRGKMILFGEEYYVREIGYPPGFISAYKATILNNVSNNSFTYYGGYGFRSNEKLYDCDYDIMVCWQAGVNMSVLKPNGQLIPNVSVKNTADVTIDNIIISLNNATYVPIDMPTQLVSSIIVYNKSTETILENGYPLQLEGTIKTGWIVNISAKKKPFDAGMNISEYANIADNQYLLTNATIRYTAQVTLNMSTYLTLPRAYKVISNGTNLEVVDLWSTTTTTSLTTTTTSTSSTTTTTAPDCSMVGDLPPCGQISLGEIINLINQWAAGTANLSDVITLINAWASV